MRALVLGVATAACALSIACDRSGGTRRLTLRGLPTCPRNVAYARPIVVRVDRDRSVFEDAYTAQITFDRPIAVGALDVLRQRMKATIRVGLCISTSLGTWDCAAPTWLGSETLTLDGRDRPFDVDLPPSEAPCADGSTGKSPR
jgi:hypothetical protein